MAGNSLLLPLVALSAFAIPIGIIAGLFYTLKIGIINSPAGFDITKIPIASEIPIGGRYGALHHVAAYILCHMRRGIRKTTILLFLTVVMTAGIGIYTLTRITYQDAFYKLDVKGKAMEFSSSSIMELLKSELAENVYYYNKLSVYVDGIGFGTPMIFTNDFEHYLEKDYTITYAQGYDSSVFDGTGSVCLLGQVQRGLKMWNKSVA